MAPSDGRHLMWGPWCQWGASHRVQRTTSEEITTTCTYRGEGRPVHLCQHLSEVQGEERRGEAGAEEEHQEEHPGGASGGPGPQETQGGEAGEEEGGEVGGLGGRGGQGVERQGGQGGPTHHHQVHAPGHQQRGGAGGEGGEEVVEGAEGGGEVEEGGEGGQGLLEAEHPEEGPPPVELGHLDTRAVAFIFTLSLCGRNSTMYYPDMTR